MATTFSYAALWAVPLPDQMGGSSTLKPRTLACISCTGPATSVSDGMAIGSIATDFTIIEEAWQASYCSDAKYRYDFNRGTAGAVASATIVCIATSTGSLLAGGGNLTSDNFHLMVVGSGPLAGF
ncbi:MAG: hypothetical protein GY720_01660 [bacterium]|nr:hypothetical protein [bacterium]